MRVRSGHTHPSHIHTHARAQTRSFVEVKTTATPDLNVFEISPYELDFATTAVAKRRINYHIYRVFGAGDPGRVRVTVIDDVTTALQERRAKLCMAV